MLGIGRGPIGAQPQQRPGAPQQQQPTPAANKFVLILFGARVTWTQSCDVGYIVFQSRRNITPTMYETA
jgi:hypothetical protein